MKKKQRVPRGIYAKFNNDLVSKTYAGTHHVNPEEKQYSDRGFGYIGYWIHCDTELLDWDGRDQDIIMWFEKNHRGIERNINRIVREIFEDVTRVITNVDWPSRLGDIDILSFASLEYTVFLKEEKHFKNEYAYLFNQANNKIIEYLTTLPIEIEPKGGRAPRGWSDEQRAEQGIQVSKRYKNS